MLSDHELFSFVRQPQVPICPELGGLDLTDMHAHLLVLWTIARFLPGKLIVELGTHDGTSTLPLLKAASEIDGAVHSIDIAPCPAAAEAVRRYGLGSWWTFHQTSTRDFATRCPNPIDLLFIDADHSEAAVREDFELYAPLVRPGGLILMHDYLLDQGVGPFVNRELRGRAGFEVAVLPYCWGLVIARKL